MCAVIGGGCRTADRHAEPLRWRERSLASIVYGGVGAASKRITYRRESTNELITVACKVLVSIVDSHTTVDSSIVLALVA